MQTAPEPEQRDRSERPGARLADTCLPLLLPAGVRRIRCHDAATAARLSTTGADVDDRAPQVEIGALEHLSGASNCVLVPIEPDDGRRDALAGWHGRALRRLRGHAELRVAVWACAHELRRRGYDRIDVVRWDKGRAVPLDGQVPGGLTGRFPQRAVVRGIRGARPQSAYEHALASAAAAVGSPLTPRRTLARSGALVVLTEEHVVRVAAGPGWDRIAHQATVLTALEAGVAPFAHLLPRQLGQGEHGVTRWSVERRVPGRPAPREFATDLREDVLTFLADLFACDVEVPASPPLDDLAGTVAGFVNPTDAARLERVVSRATAVLRGAPRGLVHGDLFRGNLMVRDGRLAGVIDWDTARTGPPFVDLLHLLVTDGAPRGATAWGPAVVDDLLPQVRAGGGATIRRYAERLDIAPDPVILEAALTAYWLERVAYQVTRYGDRAGRRVWLERNVRGVLDALDGQAS